MNTEAFLLKRNAGRWPRAELWQGTKPQQCVPGGASPTEGSLPWAQHPGVLSMLEYMASVQLC